AHSEIDLPAADTEIDLPATAKSQSTAAQSTESAKPPKLVARIESAAEDGRPQRSKQLRLDPGPRDIERLIQIHPVGDRPAGDQGHVYVLPIFIARVFNDGPALKERLAVLVQHQAIARLPDRVLHHVADADAALAVSLEIQRDHLLLRVVSGRQHLQGALELAVERGIRETDALYLPFRNALHPFGRQQVEHVDGHI